MSAKKPKNGKLTWNLGDRVRIRYHENLEGRIVELHGPLGPGGAQVYRIEFAMDPEPMYADVREDQLIPIESKS
jgi:hypothetical protein